MKTLALSICALLLSLQSHAQSLSFSRNARTLESQSTTALSKALAHACLGLMDLADGLPCNPAVGAFRPAATFGVNLLISNGYTNFQNIQGLLKGEVTQETIDKLFTTGQVKQIEAGGNLFFKSKSFSGQYIPTSIRGLSTVRNEANPDVEIRYVEESEFAFQFSHAFGKTFALGLRSRFLSRKSLDRRFKLVDLGTEAGRDSLKAKEESIISLEPGLMWILSDKWSPRISAAVESLKVSQTGESYLSTRPNPQVGFAVSPDIAWGKLDLLLEARRLSREYNESDIVHFGALYGYGSMSLAGGIDAQGFSTGVFFAIERLSAGLTFSTTKTPFQNASYYAQTVYAQIGWVL